jgi:hypothetical protein
VALKQRFHIYSLPLQLAVRCRRFSTAAIRQLP